MTDAVFSKAVNQSDEAALTSKEVKTVSMGWGQEEIISPKREILSPQKPKNSDHYFFVKQPGF